MAFQAEHPQLLQPLLTAEGLQPLQHPHGLLCTHSNSSRSFLCSGTQSWRQGWVLGGLQLHGEQSGILCYPLKGAKCTNEDKIKRIEPAPSRVLPSGVVLCAGIHQEEILGVPLPQQPPQNSSMGTLARLWFHAQLSSQLSVLLQAEAPMQALPMGTQCPCHSGFLQLGPSLQHAEVPQNKDFPKGFLDPGDRSCCKSQRLHF